MELHNCDSCEKTQEESKPGFQRNTPQSYIPEPLPLYLNNSIEYLLYDFLHHPYFMKKVKTEISATHKPKKINLSPNINGIDKATANINIESINSMIENTNKSSLAFIRASNGTAIIFENVLSIKN